MIINEDYVWLSVSAVLSLEQKDKNEYMPFCTLAAKELGSKLSSLPEETLIITAAAFLAIYYYCLINNIADLGEVEFEAGDVSVKCNPKESGIDELKKVAYMLVRPYLLAESEFYFGAV